MEGDVLLFGSLERSFYSLTKKSLEVLNQNFSKQQAPPSVVDGKYSQTDTLFWWIIFFLFWFVCSVGSLRVFATKLSTHLFLTSQLILEHVTTLSKE